MEETCNVKLASVATDVFGKSGRDMRIERIGEGGIHVNLPKGIQLVKIQSG
jgi:hypothetical protein